MTIQTQSDARKETIDEKGAWERLSKAATLFIGKGKKILVMDPAKDGKEEILRSVLGRSRTLRAPTIQVGSDFYVGFNDSLYNDLK